MCGYGGTDHTHRTTFPSSSRIPYLMCRSSELGIVGGNKQHLKRLQVRRPYTCLRLFWLPQRMVVLALLLAALRRPRYMPAWPSALAALGPCQIRPLPSFLALPVPQSNRAGSLIPCLRYLDKVFYSLFFSIGPLNIAAQKLSSIFALTSSRLSSGRSLTDSLSASSTD